MNSYISLSLSLAHTQTVFITRSLNLSLLSMTSSTSFLFGFDVSPSPCSRPSDLQAASPRLVLFRIYSFLSFSFPRGDSDIPMHADIKHVLNEICAILTDKPICQLAANFSLITQLTLAHSSVCHYQSCPVMLHCEGWLRNYLSSEKVWVGAGGCVIIYYHLLKDSEGINNKTAYYLKYI